MASVVVVDDDNDAEKNSRLLVALCALYALTLIAFPVLVYVIVDGSQECSRETLAYAYAANFTLLTLMKTRWFGTANHWSATATLFFVVAAQLVFAEMTIEASLDTTCPWRSWFAGEILTTCACASAAASCCFAGILIHSYLTSHSTARDCGK